MFLIGLLSALKGKITLILSIVISLLLALVSFLLIDIYRKEADIVLLEANIKAQAKGMERDIIRDSFNHRQDLKDLLYSKDTEAFFNRLYQAEENLRAEKLKKEKNNEENKDE